MTATDDPDTFTPAPPETEAPPPQTSQMLYGSGQALWLAVVTVIAVLALIVALLALWVDGGEEGGTAAPGSDLPTVSAEEFRFDPADLSIPAGQPVSVELVNDGSVEHNWSILAEPIESEDEFEESMVIAGVETTEPGKSRTAEVTLDAGEYQVICTISGHLEAGMEGTVTVG